MSTNLATLIGGPCLIIFDGSTFRSKGDVTVDLSLETFAVINDLYQAVDQRVSGQPIKISFDPEGRFQDYPVLLPYLDPSWIGQFVTRRYPCGAVVAADDTIAVAATDLPVATPVSFGSRGTMPAGLTAPGRFFLGANIGGLRKVYDTAADAVAATSAKSITDAGTGALAFVTQKPLVIIGNDGERFTFHNVAVTKMPTINLKATETLWGGVEFESYSKNGVSWDTANSFYTIDSTTFADEGFDPADILTQPYSLTWGTGIWAGAFSKAGIVIEPTLSLDPVTDDSSGVLTRRISGIGFTAKAQPMGPGLDDFLTALKIQGAGATRGRSLAGPNLDIAGDGVFLRLYAAALSGGPAVWSSKNDRIGELTWAATRTFTDGAANPLLLIGTESPD